LSIYLILSILLKAEGVDGGGDIPGRKKNYTSTPDWVDRKKAEGCPVLVYAL
jgi:hypothetical protein